LREHTLDALRDERLVMVSDRLHDGPLMLLEFLAETPTFPAEASGLR
jgi:hypothetical protein